MTSSTAAFSSSPISNPPGHPGSNGVVRTGVPPSIANRSVMAIWMSPPGYVARCLRQQDCDSCPRRRRRRAKRFATGAVPRLVEDLRCGPLNHRALDSLPPGRIRVPTLSSGTDEVRLGRGILQDSTLMLRHAPFPISCSWCQLARRAWPEAGYSRRGEWVVGRNRWWMVAPLLFLVVILVAPVGAVSPVGADKFNVRAQIDLSKLTRDNFTAMVTPAAKSQSGLVFYDFADTLCELLTKESADFTQQTGIAVKHVCVDGDTATQQLIAEAQAGKTASADVFFGPNNNGRALTKGGVIANLPLVDLLPNATDVEQAAARASRGFKHGGTGGPLHPTPTALGYNSALVGQPPQNVEG